MKTTLVAVVATLAMLSTPVLAHDGTEPTAAFGGLLISVSADGVAVCNDTNGNGVIDREAHEDDPETEEDESHSADECLL